MVFNRPAKGQTVMGGTNQMPCYNKHILAVYKEDVTSGVTLSGSLCLAPQYSIPECNTEKTTTVRPQKCLHARCYWM